MGKIRKMLRNKNCREFNFLVKPRKDILSLEGLNGRYLLNGIKMLMIHVFSLFVRKILTCWNSLDSENTNL